MLWASQGWAAFHGRPFVIPEDVQELAPYVWGHRIIVEQEEGVGPGRAAISRLLQSVAVPV